jgi:hypothetical protein
LHVLLNVTNSFKTKKEWTKYIHKECWGGSVRARIKFRTGSEAVTEVEIREAFDKGEEVSLAFQSMCDALLN